LAPDDFSRQLANDHKVSNSQAFIRANPNIDAVSRPTPSREGKLSNVDQVLTKMRTAYEKVKQSTFKILFYFYIFVAAVGFEPMTFRL